MSVHKANRFIRTAQESGWETRYEILSTEDSCIKVIAKRGPEQLTIEWQNNQLSYPPEYRFHEMILKLHSRKVAEGKLRAAKPDVDQYHKYQRRKRNSAPTPAYGGTGQAMSTGSLNTADPLLSEGTHHDTASEVQSNFDLVSSLPFDIHEDSDSTILKAIRGNTVIFRNSVSGAVENVFVPFKTSDGRVYNYDTTNVFFLAESEAGRAYLSFMDGNGCFRAVHLDRLIGVV